MIATLCHALPVVPLIGYMWEGYKWSLGIVLCSLLYVFSLGVAAFEYLQKKRSIAIYVLNLVHLFLFAAGSIVFLAKRQETNLNIDKISGITINSFDDIVDALPQIDNAAKMGTNELKALKLKVSDIVNGLGRHLDNSRYELVEKIEKLIQIRDTFKKLDISYGTQINGIIKNNLKAYNKNDSAGYLEFLKAINCVSPSMSDVIQKNGPILDSNNELKGPLALYKGEYTADIMSEMKKLGDTLKPVLALHLVPVLKELDDFNPDLLQFVIEHAELGEKDNKALLMAHLSKIVRSAASEGSSNPIEFAPYTAILEGDLGACLNLFGAVYTNMASPSWDARLDALESLADKSFEADPDRLDIVGKVLKLLEATINAENNVDTLSKMKNDLGKIKSTRGTFGFKDNPGNPIVTGLVSSIDEKKARLEKERLEELEKECLGKERLEKERLEMERLERERLEMERLEKEIKRNFGEMQVNGGTTLDEILEFINALHNNFPVKKTEDGPFKGLLSQFYTKVANNLIEQTSRWHDPDACTENKGPLRKVNEILNALEEYDPQWDKEFPLGLEFDLGLINLKILSTSNFSSYEEILAAFEETKRRRRRTFHDIIPGEFPKCLAEHIIRNLPNFSANDTHKTSEYLEAIYMNSRHIHYDIYEALLGHCKRYYTDKENYKLDLEMKNWRLNLNNKT